MLSGTQGGKSALLSELSGLLISYHTFLVDCNRHMSVENVMSLVKWKILYGQNKKNLILVDDLHLPVRAEMCEILRTVVDKGCLPIFQTSGKLNQHLNDPKIIATWNPSTNSK